MNILQINTERGWRGGERQTLYTLQGLAERGHRAVLLCRAGEPLERAALDAGIPPRDVHGVPGQTGALAHLFRHGRDYDIIHAQTAKGQSAAVLAGLCGGPPLVYTRRVDFRPRSLTTALKYSCTTATVAISLAIKSILESSNVVVDRVIPSAAMAPAIDPERVARLRERHGLQNRRVIGVAAAFAPHKDPLTMVRAAAGLATLRDDWVLLHFGAGEMETAVREAVADSGLENRYRLMGFESRLDDWFGIFDLFAMSSREEGLGSVVIDAFLASTPVVATRAGGLEELVEGRGLLCPVANARCLAEAMHTLLGDAELCTGLTAKARAYALEHHDVDTMVDAYVELYTGIMDASRS